MMMMRFIFFFFIKNLFLYSFQSHSSPHLSHVTIHPVYHILSHLHTNIIIKIYYQPSLSSHFLSFSNLWELVCFFKFHLIQFNQPLFLLNLLYQLSITNYLILYIYHLLFYIIYFQSNISSFFFEPIRWRNWFSFPKSSPTPLPHISPPTRFHSFPQI